MESQVPSVVLIERFLCLEIGGEYHKFVQGQFLPSKLDENGNIVIFSETGFPILCKDYSTRNMYFEKGYGCFQSF